MAKIIITEELRNHVNAICAKSKAWAEAAPEGEFRGYASYDEADMVFYCEHYTKGERCMTPAEWDQAKAWEEYYDAFKSAEGIRPRWTSWQDESAEEWDRLTTECYEKASAEYEREQAEESHEYESPAELSNKIVF
jgi:hypothetical protein